MEITSPAFETFGEIPLKYSCNGEDINPPLTISEVPDNAHSLALIADDPDAMMGTFTHWVIWNIDPKIGEIKEGEVPEDAVEGINSGSQVGYTGPCPPRGKHRYFFKLYALDKVLEVNPDYTKEDLMEAMEDRVVDSAELVGTYGDME
jgi:Raf kinase inhibitor-like YbhB/YbcL family protein